MRFSFTLRSVRPPLGKLRVEYAMDFMKKNGKASRKLFKLSEAEHGGNIKSYCKSYSFQKISSRQYYTGAHGLVILVNGSALANATFEFYE